MLPTEGHRGECAVIKGLEDRGTLLSAYQQPALPICSDDTGRWRFVRIGKGHRRPIYHLYESVGYGCPAERLRWSRTRTRNRGAVVQGLGEYSQDE
jgi:hypothetical protein